jgi:hypothetical protein
MDLFTERLLERAGVCTFALKAVQNGHEYPHGISERKKDPNFIKSVEIARDMINGKWKKNKK